MGDKPKTMREQALQTVDDMIKAHQEYIALLHKLKIGIDQHFNRQEKEKQKWGVEIQDTH
jgi:hypothetical protein